MVLITIMSYELDPVTGEVLRSEQLRDATLSLVPQVAVEKKLDVQVRYPLPRPSLSFVEVEYLPDAEDEEDRLRLFVIETQPVSVVDGEIVPRKHLGTAKKCWIDPESADIQQYYEAVGELDYWGNYFIEDNSLPMQPGQKPLTHDEWLVLSLLGRKPQSAEEAKFNELTNNLQSLTKDKLELLFGYFVELGVVDK